MLVVSVTEVPLKLLSVINGARSLHKLIDL